MIFNQTESYGSWNSNCCSIWSKFMEISRIQFSSTQTSFVLLIIFGAKHSPGKLINLYEKCFHLRQLLKCLAQPFLKSSRLKEANFSKAWNLDLKKICSNLKTYFSIHCIDLIYLMQFFFQISLIRHYFIHVQCGLSLRF